MFLAAGCGGTTGDAGGTAIAAPPTTASEGPAGPVDRIRSIVTELSAAITEKDMAGLRRLADPDSGIWFWADPGQFTVPCAWVDPTDEIDPFTPDNQQCLNGHMLDYYARALSETLPVAGIDRPRYDVPPEAELPSAPAWGSIDTEADVAQLRTVADYARASSSVRAAIDGAPIVHAYRAELAGRSVTVYLTERFGELFVSHVLAFSYLGNGQ